jgi:hypothetical protein
MKASGVAMTTRLSIAALVAACAALAFTPAAAMGKKLKFRGPLNQPYIPSPNGFATEMPSIEIKVVFDGKKPTAVVKVRVRGIYGPCDASNGCTPTCVTATGICEPPICRSGADLDQFKVKKRGRFAVTRKDLVNGSDDVITVTGRATRQGASGTVRVVSPHPASSSRPAYTCDTGAVSWTATK